MKYILICLGLIMTISSYSQSFCLPEISTCIITPEDRASFLVSHYWDLYPFNAEPLPEDTTEQAMVNYIDLFRFVSKEEAMQSLKSTMNKAANSEKDVFTFYNLFEKYLYDFDSPMKNEEMFIPVLEAFIDSKIISEDDKIRPAYLLEMAKKNRIGTIAANFGICMNNDEKSMLHNLPDKITIMYFYDPGCDECSLFTEKLRNNTTISRLQKENKLQILAVYTGNDKSLWNEYRKNIPEGLINCYDYNMDIENNALYDIKVFPTIYLLDKDKSIIQKETDLNSIIKFCLNYK